MFSCPAPGKTHNPGCDKNMPGALMAMLRLNRPGVLVYGGTIAPGCHNGKKLDVVSAFEAWGENVAGKIDDKQFKDGNVWKGSTPSGELRPTRPGALYPRQLI